MAKIIVIDDSTIVRIQVRQALEMEGHSVIEAIDGNDGYQKLVSEKPDLVVCDYNMPGMDGLTMLERVDTALGKKKYPVLMLTTETPEHMRVRGKDVGVVGWINKPFRLDLFKAAVKKILEKKVA